MNLSQYVIFKAISNRTILFMLAFVLAIPCLWSCSSGEDVKDGLAGNENVSGKEDAGTDTDSDTDTDTDTDSDTDMDADIDTDAESDPDGDAGTEIETDISYEVTGPPDEKGPCEHKGYNVQYGSSSGTIRYPTNGEEGELFPGIAISNGAAGTKETITWIGNHLSSHCYVTITITPPQLIGQNTKNWADSLLGAINKIKNENNSSDSPMYGVLDESRLGTIGFSMGGGGSLEAASRNSEIGACVGLAPAVGIAPGIKSVTVPAQLIVGSTDATVAPGEVTSFYNGKKIADTTSKELVIIRGSGHMANLDINIAGVGIGGNEQYHNVASRFFTSWFQYHLKGLTDYYHTYIFGESAQADRDENRLTKLEFSIP